MEKQIAKRNKLLVLQENNIIYSMVCKDSDIVQINAEPADHKVDLLGTIYVGKVKNIVKNINAAFVEIADGRMCYLPLSKPQYPIFSNGVKKENIHIGDELMVQIEKENIKTKAPSVTCNLNLTGKYVVLTHGDNKVGVSAKIKDSEERKRLRELVLPYATSEYGFVIRTNSLGISDELILREIQILQDKYERISTNGIYFTRFSLIEKGLRTYLSDIRDSKDYEVDEIVTDNKEIFEEIQEYLLDFQKQDLEKLRFYQDDMISLKNLYGVDAKLQKALQKKVWLKSGGYLVIEPTEALTVIDINTGKAIKGKKNEQQTFYKINTEAAVEIARQVRLRNISGIIIIDFIDLADKEKRDELMNLLKELFAKDPVKTHVVDMTALNLVEVTRKKIRKPLWEQINNRSDEDE